MPSWYTAAAWEKGDFKEIKESGKKNKKEMENSRFF